MRAEKRLNKRGRAVGAPAGNWTQGDEKRGRGTMGVECTLAAIGTEGPVKRTCAGCVYRHACKHRCHSSRSQSAPLLELDELFPCAAETVSTFAGRGGPPRPIFRQLPFPRPLP
eukprot:7830740-Pyramimonas_sp.AAC.2